MLKLKSYVEFKIFYLHKGIHHLVLQGEVKYSPKKFWVYNNTLGLYTVQFIIVFAWKIKVNNK